MGSSLLRWIAIAALGFIGKKVLQKIEKPLINQREIDRQKGKDSQIHSMVPCRYCGVHIPKSDAIENPHGFFCCQDHVLAHCSKS